MNGDHRRGAPTCAHVCKACALGFLGTVSWFQGIATAKAVRQIIDVERRGMARLYPWKSGMSLYLEKNDYNELKARKSSNPS